MPGVFDPFTPGQTDDPTAGVDPQTYDKVKQEWNAFLGNPQGRAALLSSGLALMPPPSFGDTGASQIGRAIGAAGASATQNQATDMKQQELDSKQDLRSSQAVAAEARAGTAAERNNTATLRLQMQQAEGDRKREASMLGARVRLSNMYQNEVANIRKLNANNKLMGQPEVPIPAYTEWVQNNPMLRSLGLIPDSPAATSDDELLPTPGPTSQAAPAGAPQQMPQSRAQLQPGVTYSTPRGPLKWTGTGFIQP